MKASVTLAEIRQWPATVSVTLAAAALGCSASGVYEAIRTGTFQCRTLRVGGRIRVVTSSILALLEGTQDKPLATRSSSVVVFDRKRGIAS